MAARPPRLRTPTASKCRRRFLRFFPGGFTDETYLDWERTYKREAHSAWLDALASDRFRALLAAKRYAEIASAAVRIESRTNLLFSFEKMALRDAVRTGDGARGFAEGLYEFLHGKLSDEESRFERWCERVDALPRRQTRVLTWPVVTVFGFLALPRKHLFVKPGVTHRAAERCGYDVVYRSRPNWQTYESVLRFARALRRDLADFGPRDMIDIQSYMWTVGSDEYDEME